MVTKRQLLKDDVSQNATSLEFVAAVDDLNNIKVSASTAGIIIYLRADCASSHLAAPSQLIAPSHMHMHS
jgi:hypothetical protein